MIGQQFDNYQIERLIDQGGMADVYLAHDLGLERPVVLKLLKPALAQDDEFVARFHREVQVTAQINHPNVVHVYGTGNTPGGRPYLAMQYITGGSLHDKIIALKKQDEGLPVTTALVIIRQIADALTATHAANIVHRDIKPTNILLHENGTPLLSDLGIASVKNATTKLTQTGTVLGTPHYMSPEQSQNKPVDGRSDLYSLGIILYELLAQKRPFEADSPLVVLHQHIYEQPEPLEEIKPKLSASSYTVVATCLQKEPNNRYQTAADLVKALDLALMAEGGGSLADSAFAGTSALDERPYPSSLTPTRKAARRFPLWLFPLAILIIILGITGAFWFRSTTAVIPTPTAIPATKPANNDIIAVVGIPTAIPTTTPLPTDSPVATDTVAPTAVPTQPSTPIAIPSPTLFPNGLIAYTCGGEGARQIYLSTANGRVQYLLPNQPTNSTVPNFSHDGRQISYRSDASGSWQIYASRLDGSDFRQITIGEFNNYEPTWSPDGSQFVFASDRTGSRELYRMETDGSEQIRLTYSDTFNDDPAWSVDGWVAYESYQDGRYSIFLLWPATGQSQLFLNVGHSSTTPAWSYDGQHLAFEVGDGDNGYTIWMVNRDGTNLQPIATAGTINARPAWSPDGQRLAFHSDNQQDDGLDIWIINVTTKLIQRITSQGNCINPAWSWGEGVADTAVPILPPLAKTPAPICPLSSGAQASAGADARLWTGPDVNNNSPSASLDEGTAVTIIGGPTSGNINYATDDVGWWWQVETETGLRGWLWQDRLVECLADNN